jgi:Zn-dependent protease
MTFPVGSILGIPIRVHLLVPVLAVVLVVTTPQYTRAEILLALGAFLAVMVLSTVAHELGHALVARRNRLRAHGILIWPLGGLTEHDAPRSASAKVQVALAGVAVNVLLALLAGAAYYARSGGPPGWPQLRYDASLLLTCWNLNLALALLNLLPGLPFDGGMAVEGLLWGRLGRPRAHLVVIATGGLINVGLVLGGIANDDFVLATLGCWGLMEVHRHYREFREGGPEDESLLGVYDFSQGHTSLDASAPEPERVDRRRGKDRERARRDAERRIAADREATESAKVRLDRLLERIAAEGMDSISSDERAFLEEESRRLRAMKRGKSPTRP